MTLAKRFYSLILFLILLISFFFRIYRLNNLTLFGDELDVGYQAYSLLTTASDYRGHFLPVYLQSLNESRAPLFIYASIPAIAAFGLTTLGVRLTPLIFGLLSLFLFSQLLLRLTRNKTLTLVATLILSFTPWHFHYSRTAFEVTLLLSLILAGTIFYYRYLQTQKFSDSLFSLGFFILSLYTYNTANIFTPSLLLYLVLSTWSELKSLLNFKRCLLHCIFGLIFSLPLLTQIFFGSAANRFGLISIFTQPTIIANIINQRTDFTSSRQPQESFFHNKPQAWLQEFSQNYTQAISPDFLFFQADTNPRHSLTNFGLISAFLLPFFIIGLFSSTSGRLKNLMIFWLLIAPIPAALTFQGGHHATRLFLLLPPLAFFIASGITTFFEKIRVRSNPAILTFAIFVFSFIYIVQLSFYFHQYFVHYPKLTFESWHYGFPSLFSDLPHTNNQRIFISNRRFNSLLPFMFYYQLPPKQILSRQPLDQPQTDLIPGLTGFQLSDHLLFFNQLTTKGSFPENLTPIAKSGDIFVLFQLDDIPGDWDLSRSPPSGFRPLKTVYQPNQTIFGQVIQKL